MMDRNALLRMLGFTQEFISELEAYEKGVIRIVHDNLSDKGDIYDVADSTNIFLTDTDANSNTRIIVDKV